MIQEATILLQEHSLRVTQPRLALLLVLFRAQRPLRAQEVADKLPKGRADTATVYRSMNALVDAGIVRRIDLDAHAKFFELDRGDDHHHLVCTLCQKIEDVHACEIDTITKQVLNGSTFSQINHHHLEFFGVCLACSQC
ncbi:TPA: hypothetical protein DEB00_01560 [Candidatus Uhrbacteria bacterium]|nr:hypothetical protein [Candidatus Uhrbacteria bacterium]